MLNINCKLSQQSVLSKQSKWQQILNASLEITVAKLCYLITRWWLPGSGGGYKPTPSYGTTPTPSYSFTPSTPSTSSYGVPEIPKHRFVGSCE